MTEPTADVVDHTGEAPVAENVEPAADHEDGFVPDADRVAQVSIDVNGNPAQSHNFHVLLPEDATDEHKAAAHNEAGRKLGAKHVTEADHEAADKRVGLKPA